MKRTRGQNAILLLFPLFVALAVLFQVVHPSYDVTQFTGAVIPLAAIGFFLTEGAFAARQRNRIAREEEKGLRRGEDPKLEELDALRRKFAKQVTRRELLVLPPDFLDRRKRDLEAEKRSQFDQIMAELNSGLLSRDEARVRWTEARRLLDSLGEGRLSPASQVKELGAQYGLPVATPLQKSEPLPMVIVPPVSAGGAISMAQFNAGLRNLLGQPPETFPDGGEFVTDDAPEEEYSPAGQPELSADLLVTIKQEVRARGGKLTEQQSHFPSFHWFMSPEWLAEVRKLRAGGASGALLFTPRERVSRSKFEGRLYGYPVVVGDAFGVPELREP